MDWFKGNLQEAIMFTYCLHVILHVFTCLFICLHVLTCFMCAYHPIADLPIIQIWETQQNSAFLAVAFHHWQQAGAIRIYPLSGPMHCCNRWRLANGFHGHLCIHLALQQSFSSLLQDMVLCGDQPYNSDQPATPNLPMPPNSIQE